MRDSAGRVLDQQLATPRDPNGGFTQGGVQVIDPVSMQDVKWEEDAKPDPKSFRTQITGAILRR